MLRIAILIYANQQFEKKECPICFAIPATGYILECKSGIGRISCENKKKVCSLERKVHPIQRVMLNPPEYLCS